MWQSSIDYLVYDLFKLDGHLGEVINFFIYDTGKILFLLLSIIFVVSYLRTPFCSCSAIPLFLGFIQARIPIGVTFSFLISSPMNNEIAISLLFGLFGIVGLGIIAIGYLFNFLL